VVRLLNHVHGRDAKSPKEIMQRKRFEAGIVPSLQKNTRALLHNSSGAFPWLSSV